MSAPLRSCTHWDMMSNSLALSLKNNNKQNRTAFCLDSPNSFSGITEAWSSCTSGLRVMMVTRRRTPTTFMVLLEVCGKNAAAELSENS